MPARTPFAPHCRWMLRFRLLHEVVDAFDDAVDVVHFLLLGFLLSFV